MSQTEAEDRLAAAAQMLQTLLAGTHQQGADEVPSSPVRPLPPESTLKLGLACHSTVTLNLLALNQLRFHPHWGALGL